MTSKRFEETKIAKIGDSAIWECAACKEQFDFFSPAAENQKPKFCPMCGRRNSDA